MKKNPKVDGFISRSARWRDEFEKLRSIALECGLTEELKWGSPCYTHQGRNIVLIHGFKDYCAYLFFKGALLKDAKGILVQQTENVQSGRHVRFSTLKEIVDLEPDIKDYIREAIGVEMSGLRVTLKQTSEYSMPEELQNKLDNDPAFRTAFEGLTPGRQRAYIFYISSAKQKKTREARLEKYVRNILDGKGIND